MRTIDKPFHRIIILSVGIFLAKFAIVLWGILPGWLECVLYDESFVLDRGMLLITIILTILTALATFASGYFVLCSVFIKFEK